MEDDCSSHSRLGGGVRRVAGGRRGEGGEGEWRGEGGGEGE